MTGYCEPVECRTVQSFVWAGLLISFIINITQCMYAHNINKRYSILKEQIPILNSLLEEVAAAEGEIPEARIVSEI